jgi:hypothetical protein
MGTTFFDLAIIDYQLLSTYCVKQTSDCHQVPTSDYRLWQKNGSFPITASSVTSAK